ncbi:MAG: GAF domain-containing protein, partial [Aliifodinibius sp.]|nr:GAF domain-containing protein [Fodinibius sp.]NIV13008.1 GAF domain-containing protein [Fodinibius sp.]NIY26677.1 GAF domain-containing protein [Fodinibius sp.]
WATHHGKARIALDLDVGDEPGRFSHPYLPLTRSEIALPLITRTKVIGALDVQSQEQNAFSDDDIATLQLMANQLANVIDNARLFETTQQNLREIDLLYRTTQALIKAGNEEELFSLFIEKTAELGADSVSVSLFGGEGEDRYLEVKKIWSRYSTPFQTGQRHKLKGFFLEPLITQAKMFVIQDIATDERLTDAMRQQFRALDAYSIVIIPIMLQEPVGTVHITYKKQPQTFTDSQTRLFESMVQQLTLIWQNLRLVASLERQFRRERIIREVTGKIHAATGVDQILRTTVFELTKALNTPAGVVHLKTNQNAEPSPAEATSPDQSDN